MVRPARVEGIVCRVSTLDALREESGGLGTGCSQSDEAKRALGISHPNRRAQFLAGRWLTRELLCQTLGGTHSAWQISSQASSKPRILGRDDLHFSIAHSKTWVACAIASHSIGLDVEQVHRSRDVTELARTIDAMTSIEELQGADDAERLSVAWTLKEACMKRTGQPFDISAMRGMRFALSAADQANVACWLDGAGFAMAIASDEVDLTHLHGVSPGQAPSARYYRLLDL